MESNDATVEDKLLQNSLLFNAIRKNKTPGDKVKKMIKYLSRGADINAVDANQNHNTPLHVAVTKGEIEVVIFLLDRGANSRLKNSINLNALEIAQQPETCNGSEMAIILKSYLIKNQTLHQNKQEEQVNLENTTDQGNKLQAQKQYKVESESIKQENLQYYYQKRSGTSGLSGQLYETKLLSLILIRALYSDKINEFYLGTNVDGIGAFDDIIFRYNVKGTKKTKILFLQAKHREDPTKDQVTVEEVLKQNGDFSLHKYMDSYIKICQKFSPGGKDNLFMGSMIDLDCDFIIFTPAFENFTKKKMIDPRDEEYFIRTNNNGKIFQFQYDDEDIELLVRTVSGSRAVALAKRFCQYILKDNNKYKNMMMDDLIKTYHVFLTQSVITLETTPQGIEAKYTFLVGKFQNEFLTSNDDIMVLMKRTIFKEIADLTKSNKLKKIDMHSLTFKLPVNFGNIYFNINGSEAKKEKRVKYLFAKFQNLIQSGYETDTNIILIKINEDMIGSNKMLQDKDFETYRLGGLVGNLLTLDDETKLLKFNLNARNLSEDNVKLLHLLQQGSSDLSQIRFDFNISRFPKLTLVSDEYDRNVVQVFLSKLKFYTNQAKEDEVENIVKEDIDKFCNIKQSQNESLFRIKCDAIFLKVHDKIQKWWKQSVRAPYLTTACKLYHDAQKDISDSPLLSFVNIVYRENMKNILIKFVSAAIETLEIETFLNCGEKTSVIVSNEISFTCIKLIQFFEDTNFDQCCLFLDLDFVIIENYFESVQSELEKSKVEVLTVVSQNGANITRILEKINILLHSYKGKLIIVTNSDLKDKLDTVLSDNVIYEVDNDNSLNDVVGEYRERILAERKILFQGYELSLDTLLDYGSFHFVKAKVLRKIINNEQIEVGSTLNNPSYNAIANFYINQGICRYITLDTKKEGYDVKFNMESKNLLEPLEDTILVSQSEKEYEDLCSRYPECKVHWFSCEGNLCVWKKSHGHLKALLRYVQRGEHESYINRPKTLKDVDEKIVIISAEPGMGKSTLLTHLAIQTKRMYPTLWIAKINLLDHIDQFSKWKEEKIDIDMVEAIKFVYSAISTNFAKENEFPRDVKLTNELCIDNENHMHFLMNDKQTELFELSLFEINLFRYYYNKNSVALLFDGFDEICPDYANEVTQLLCTLKTLNVAHLWVTTRSYNVLHQLENALGTFSFTLQPLTRLEQETFLQKIWSSKLGIDDAYTVRFCVKKFFKVVSLALRDNEKSFTSLPLHLNMVSEIFLDFFRDYYDPNIKKYSDVYIEQVMKSFNLIHLYETFVDMKFFKIRFGEKKHFMCFKDPDMRKIVEKERRTFLENHKKFGAYFLLAKTVVKDLFSEQEINEVHEFIDFVKSGDEKSGIIEHIVGDEPKFVHITFAEYFATEFLFDKFKSESCTSGLLTVCS